MPENEIRFRFIIAPTAFLCFRRSFVRFRRAPLTGEHSAAPHSNQRHVLTCCQDTDGDSLTALGHALLMRYHSLAMVLADSQLSAAEVLRAFHHDEPYLFLGSAFTTVGVVSICFCFIRRRFDALLVWMAVFAHLYGQRLWLNAYLLQLTIPHTQFFARLTAGVDYLVPIPAFLFFNAAGFLGRRGKGITIALVTLFSILVILTFTVGPLQIFRYINNGVIVVAILVMMVTMLLSRRPADRDVVAVRVGIFAFGTLSLVDNLTNWNRVEPYGFAILLGCLGYVAARRTLQRDEELNEIQQELELARRIQFSLLPASFPSSRTFRIAARYVPMNTVAGDFYDVVSADPNHVALLIADVSGHGMPAALIASMVKMAALSQREYAAHPARLLTAMNKALYGNTQGQYVTAAALHLDAGSGVLRYAAAGHPAMLRLNGDRVTEVVENGLLLAAVDGVTYTETTVILDPGDRLLLYTDGLLEARNEAGKLFGEAALIDAFRLTGSLLPEGAADVILGKVRAWARVQDDDLTLLVCDFQPINLTNHAIFEQLQRRQRPRLVIVIQLPPFDHGAARQNTLPNS